MTTTASQAGPRLTHVRPNGEAHMVDVGAKPPTKRTAIAIAHVRVSPEVYQQIEENSNKKGDVLGIARTAGIMAAKRTSDLIPLCHPLAISKAEVDVYLVPPKHQSPIWPHAPQGRLVAIQARVECVGPTGVEMEALVAVQGAALTVVDMCKALDKRMSIDGARVVYKAGGRSGVSVDIKWKNEVGKEKFGPEGLIEGLGGGELLVRGRYNEKAGR
jgi:cyclic pyranopterin phosphate synthase